MGSPISTDGLDKGVSNKWLKLILSFEFPGTPAYAIVNLRYPKTFSKNLLLTVTCCYGVWGNNREEAESGSFRQWPTEKKAELEAAARVGVSEENEMASKLAQNRYVETLSLNVAEEYEPVRQQCQILSFQEMGLEPYSLDIKERSESKKLEDVGHPNGSYFIIPITQHSVRCQPNCIEQEL